MQTQEHGGDIYSASYRLDFSTNVNPLGTPVSVQRAVITSVGQLHQYPDVKCRELKRALSDTCRLPADWFVCGSGAAELIFAVAQAVRPKSALLIIPGFTEYERALGASGCKDIRYYQCTRASGFKVGEDILDSISEDIDMMYVNNPINPTGIEIPHDLMIRIMEKCREERVVLVIDECFVNIMEHPEQATMRGYVADDPGLFIIGAFTKLFAMPGIRLGYGITSNRLLMDQITACMQPWALSVPAQAAGVAALKEADYVKKSRRLVARELRFLKQTFERMGITYYDSSANFLFFEGPKNLFDLCAKRGYLIRDCSNFRSLEPGYFRICVRTRRENEELCGYLESIFGRSGRYLPSYAEQGNGSEY